MKLYCKRQILLKSKAHISLKTITDISFSVKNYINTK